MKSALREILETIILTAIIFLIVRSVVQNFKVDGRSMEPTLEGGQYLLINKATYWHLDPKRVPKIVQGIIPGLKGNGNDQTVYIFSPPAQGDIVVFRYPNDPSRDFIKRVIAGPGDTVEIKQGLVYVNNKPLVEPYTSDRPVYVMEKETVPRDNFFVLGDNRNNSLDSHVWGMVPIDNMIGKAWLCYWPRDKWGILPGLQSSVQRLHLDIRPVTQLHLDIRPITQLLTSSGTVP